MKFAYYSIMSHEFHIYGYFKEYNVWYLLYFDWLSWREYYAVTYTNHMMDLILWLITNCRGLMTHMDELSLAGLGQSENCV